MRRILQILSAAALALTLLPAVFYLTGSLELHQVKTAMLVATVVWFVATPFWMGQPSENSHEEVLL